MSRRNFLSASLLACISLLVAVAAGDAAAQSPSGNVQAAALAPTGKILFRTSAVDPDGTVRGSRLLRINADGSALHPLMPMVEGIFNGSPTWSPGGGLVAFERFNTLLDRTDIFLMDSQGQQLHRLTDGSTKFHKPAWGPGGTIAFVSDDGPVHWGYVGSCLGTIRADGSQQQHLFCPGVVPAQRALSPIEVSRPTWTADGTSILIEAGYYGGLTAEEWYSAMYKVDARTGAATLLTWKIGEEGGTFAPNGSDAVYVQWGCPVQPPCSAGVLSIYRFDIASQQSTQLADGYAPLYSPDGSRIAFTRTFLDTTDPDVPRYDQVFVMNADGTNIRQLTSTKVDNIEYLAADWSRDSTQLLVNRTLYSEENGRRVNPRPALRIIDIDSGAITSVSAGYAYRGAWFQPR